MKSTLSNGKRSDRDAETFVCKSPFYQTRDMFKEFIGVDTPLAYSTWMELDPDKKAAALFVNFFEQITLAWYKAKSFYAVDEDGVSTCLQYLQKNVPVIEKAPNRFSPRYIYRIAYNCMYCICHDIKIDRERYENETSNIAVSSSSGDAEELDLFSFVVASDTIDSILDRENFWNIVFSLGPDAQVIVDNLLNGTRLPAGYKAKKADIIVQLQVALSEFAED